jgi:flagellar secretion chaperone FliS
MDSSASARESYLETQVMTATPQKLLLLLIEAAIRLAQRAKQRLLNSDPVGAAEDLLKAQDVVTQIMSGMRADVAPELVKKVASVYLYVFRTLVDATREKSVKLVDDVLRVLEVERGTWQLVCERLGAVQTGYGQGAAHAAPPIPHIAGDAAEPLPDSGFSLEA